jgi:hypothetical protein
MASWRKHHFEKGRRYRVITECRVPLWEIFHFHVGEIVTFVEDSYSRYDNLSLYVFRTSSGEQRYWALHNDEPEEKWQTIFEKVDDGDG